MRTTLILTISLVFFTLQAHAQPKEKKDETIKTLEKGKRKASSKIKEDDPFFTMTQAPEKWKRESAVILYQYSKIAWKQPKRGYGSRSVYTRTRILLQDKFAINDFSSFDLPDDELLDITVIKPDGKKISFDRSRAVSSDIRLEDLLPGLTIKMQVKSKIPVPNLEPGDIIEIERYWESSGYVPPASFTLVSLNTSYPVYHRLMEFELEGNARINWKSMNGAPPLEVVKIKGKMATYEFHDSLRENLKGEYWNPGGLQLPYVKYALVTYYKGRYVNDVADKSKEPLTEITEDHLRYFAKYLYTNQERSHSNCFLDFVMAYKNKEMDDEEFVHNFYSYYRAYFFLHQEGMRARMDNTSFLLVMRRILQKRKLDFEYIVAVPRELGKLEDAISINETVWALRIKSTGQILTSMNLYSNPGDFMESIKGTEVYVIQPSKRKKRIIVDREMLPQPAAEENVCLYEINVELDSTQRILNVRRTSDISGHMKSIYNENLPFSMFKPDIDLIFNETDRRYYVPKAFYQDMNEKDYEIELDRLNLALYDELDVQSEVNMKEHHESKYYRIESYSGVEMVRDGRQVENPQLVFSETISLSGLTGRAGEYLVVDIGRLLGQQMEIIDSEDSIRNLDIYFHHPRVIRYDLRFAIPPGMRVEGAEQFSVNVENEAGSYKVTYEIRDGQFIVHAEKIYKTHYVDKKEWNKVLAFTNAATELNAKKIVLRR